MKTLFTSIAAVLLFSAVIYGAMLYFNNINHDYMKIDALTEQYKVLTSIL